jgi:hypothetical protein
MITSEDLHAAATKVAFLRNEEYVDVERGAIVKFVDETVFDNYLNVDKVSLAYGILLGITAAQIKHKEE